jgi:hypothetical protein
MSRVNPSTGSRLANGNVCRSDLSPQVVASPPMKTPRGGVLQLLVLPALALPGLAHADAPAPPAASPSEPSALAMVPPDPQPVPAVYPPAARVAAEAKKEAPTISHLGLDGALGGGLVNFAGASMRFEVRPGPTTSFVARVGYLRGSVIDDESFQAGTLSLGYRGFFSRRAYLGAEGMLMAYDEEGEALRGIVGFSAGLGLKLGAVDASAQIMYPLSSIALTLGADFATF